MPAQDLEDRRAVDIRRRPDAGRIVDLLGDM
jgi:hypothetical protein